MTTLILEVDMDDGDLSELLSSPDASLVQTDRFDGVSIAQVLVTLGGFTIPLVVQVVIAKIKAKQHIIVKKDGVTVQGIDAENAVEIIKSLSNEN